MDFGINENQSILLSSLDRLLSAKVSISQLRSLDKDGISSLRNELVDFGLYGVMADPELGGSGLKTIDSVLIAERLGYHAAPTPYLGSILSTVALRSAKQKQKERYLSKVSTGELMFALAFSEHCGTKESSKITYDGQCLSGRSLFVIDSESDLILVPTDNRRFFIVPSVASGVSIRKLKTIDITREFGELLLDGVKPEELEFIEPKDDHLKKFLAFSRLLVAADTLGACQRMLDDSVAYAKQRKQFGRLIGSFQAVKHMCAEMAAKIEPCKAMIWHAACSIDASFEDAAMEVNLCKAHLSDIGKYVAKTATEVHGGMGFTDLQGLHYWFKRIGVNRQLLGSPEHLRREAAWLQSLI